MRFISCFCDFLFFFFNDTATTEIYTLPYTTLFRSNANLSSRLPYMFACCRFAHYLKCMVRDKIGSSPDKEALSALLDDWLHRYVDGAPDRTTDEWKAAHPLVDARVVLDEQADAPGQYS